MNWRDVFFVSNLLSISRIVLLVPLYITLEKRTPTGNVLAVVVMLVIVLTDFLDGRLARRLGQQTDLGRILDPLADKIGVGVTAYLMIEFRDMPVWYVILLIGRDLAIVLMALVVMTKKKIVAESNWLGKITVSGIAVVLLVFTMDVELVKWPLLWISVVMVIASLASYSIRFYKLAGD